MATRSGVSAALQGIVPSRPVEEGDMPFLGALFASTRADEAAATGWPAHRQRQFLAQQFLLQHRYYRQHFADAEFLLLTRGGAPIGRLYWHSAPRRATLIDISLVAAERGRGLGTALLQRLVHEAGSRGQAIGLHVEPANPALRLYRRLGFEALDDNGVYLKMERPGCLRAPAACGAVA